MNERISQDIIEYLSDQSEYPMDLQDLVESIGHDPDRTTKALIALLESSDVQIVISQKVLLSQFEDRINSHLIELGAKQVDLPNESDFPPRSY